MQVFIAKNASAAVNYLEEDYIQHNPSVPTGREGFGNAFTQVFEQNPNFNAQIQRIYTDGDYVIVHLFSPMGDTDNAIVDIYRVNDKGKSQNIGMLYNKYQKNSANNNTMFYLSWNLDQYVLDPPGNKEIQLALFHDYQNNLKQYPIWHEYFRINQPPTLVAWGKNDIFFGPQGALAFQEDLKDVEVHLLNTGHFPLEEDLEVSVSLIKRLLGERIK